MCLVVSLCQYLHVAVSISALAMSAQLLTIDCSRAHEQTLSLLNQGTVTVSSPIANGAVRSTMRIVGDDILMRQETSGIGSAANPILGADQQLSQKTSRLGQKISTFM